MKKGTLGYFIIGSALIWGFVIIACAFLLKGVDQKSSVIQFMGVGAGIHLILIWGPLAAIIGKKKKEE
jgi:hypothetical protein